MAGKRLPICRNEHKQMRRNCYQQGRMEDHSIQRRVCYIVVCLLYLGLHSLELGIVIYFLHVDACGMFRIFGEYLPPRYLSHSLFAFPFLVCAILLAFFCCSFVLVLLLHILLFLLALALLFISWFVLSLYIITSASVSFSFILSFLLSSSSISILSHPLSLKDTLRLILPLALTLLSLINLFIDLILDVCSLTISNFFLNGHLEV